MNRKLVVLLIASIIFLNFVIPSASAQTSIGDTMQNTMGMLADTIYGVFGFIEDLGIEQGNFWARFLIGLALFTVLYFAGTMVFKGANKMVPGVIAFVFAVISVVAIPQTLLVAIIAEYSIINTAILILLPIIGVLYLRHKMLSSGYHHVAARGFAFFLMLILWFVVWGFISSGSGDIPDAVAQALNFLIIAIFIFALVDGIRFFSSLRGSFGGGGGAGAIPNIPTGGGGGGLGDLGPGGEPATPGRAGGEPEQEREEEEHLTDEAAAQQQAERDAQRQEREVIDQLTPLEQRQIGDIDRIIADFDVINSIIVNPSYRTQNNYNAIAQRVQDIKMADIQINSLEQNEEKLRENLGTFLHQELNELTNEKRFDNDFRKIQNNLEKQFPDKKKQIKPLMQKHEKTILAELRGSLNEYSQYQQQLKSIRGAFGVFQANFVANIKEFIELLRAGNADQAQEKIQRAKTYMQKMKDHIENMKNLEDDIKRLTKRKIKYGKRKTKWIEEVKKELK